MSFLRTSALGAFAAAARARSVHTDEWAPLKKKLSPCYFHLSDYVVESAKGSWITTTEGKKILDFTSGIAVTSTGHCHPKVVAAAQEQLTKIIHAQMNCVLSKPALRLTERLDSIVRLSADDQYFFTNSGAEAVESSVKLARQYTNKTNIVVFSGSFHGRTVGTMSLTKSKGAYHYKSAPHMPNVYTAKYPYCHRCRVRKAEEKCAAQTDGSGFGCKCTDGAGAAKGGPQEHCCHQWYDDLDDVLHCQSMPEDTAAILVETVQGEGGYLVPPPDFLPTLREICTKNNMLLILDEVQSGFGRTGKWFAREHFNVTPDIMVMAKGIASGLPISAIAAPRKIMGNWRASSHGGTYGGNAVAAAAACATIDAIREEGMLENATEQGAYLMGRLREMQQKFPPIIADVRGLGLMVGIEFHDGRAGIANDVTKRALQKGLLLLTCGPHDAIRLAPPLNVSREESEIAMNTFEECIEDILAGKK